MSEIEQQELQSVSLAEPMVERWIFSRRLVVLCLFLSVSLFLAYMGTKVRPDASLERMIPLEHPYVINFLENREDLENLANFIRISVEAKQGDIFDKDYLDVLEKISDEVFYLPGVDRTGLKSLWTPNVRWVEVTEEGFQGGTVIPHDYDGSDASLEQMRQNILRSGEIGRLVANNFKSSIVYVPLLEKNPETGEPLNYLDFSRVLEENVRQRYAGEGSKVNIQIVGFAKKIGDLIEGFSAIVVFFAVAVLITAALLFHYSRCLTSTLAAVGCSIVAVVWQMGIMHLLGYGLDPYSVLIPFIIFATAISHSVQFINGLTHEMGAGFESLEATLRTFRHHYVPAMLALISDAIGFMTLIVVEVDVIKDLAVGASVGIASIIITNMVLLPIIMSYFGVTKRGIAHVRKVEKHPSPIWARIAKMASHKYALQFIILAQFAVAMGLYVSQGLKIGELDAGAPELRPDSRYNLDNAFITSNYSTSADVMVLMVKTPQEQCVSYEVMDLMERLQWELNHTEGVQLSVSIVNISKAVTKAFNEGSYKWFELSRNQKIIDTSLQHVPSGFINRDCSLAPIFIFLNDHKAETLQRTVDVVEAYTETFESDEVQILLAAGNAGIEVATNQVIAESQTFMMVIVYVIVGMMVLLAYRSMRAVVCIVMPLIMTSILCTALMAFLGIGVKVSTLPIIALGVGLGVDYGIYIYSRLEEYLTQGMTLQRAYFHTLHSTGKAVAFTGLTLAIGTTTWIFSPIKFQADMGILLTFMFLWNMLGSITLLPMLAYYFVKDGEEDELVVYRDDLA
ncbi:RND family transporter [Oleiphilus sp. HI0128]|uniref:efflux RND transporter permease subunit n=2 Tax=Oleiphilus sp. HI0128 TaxID=1822267 RepID=UPI0007C3D92A|nr:MMPL family transporter [Oleiphilus sp. HI0128]KZZ63142.1 RND transporter [Oleiphilus sp. HI0128]